MNCANHPDRERISFCQNCGKPLCSECTRAIGAAVFCEPCLAARLAAADTATSSAGTPYGYTAPPNYAAAPAPVPGAPNPALAGLLGLIPGVGAMYNGQYAKGVVHLIIFAVLVSLSDTNGLFGLFVAGWVFYQVFESYQTARARRDGTPLPNPFGLNDIGDRFGFGKSWPANAAAPPVPPPADTPFTAPFTTPPPYTPPPTGWGAPTDTYSSYAVPPTPPIPPFSDPYVATDPAFSAHQNRFPTGAIWLIGLGVLFFFGSSGLFRGFPIHRVIPFLLIGFGVWIFVRKMTDSGAGLADDGSAAYRIRLYHAVKGSAWMILIGIMFFLDSFSIVSWGHSWPLFIIVAGLMTIFRGSAYSGAASVPYTYPTPGQVPPVPPSTPSTGTGIVPVTSHDEEGR
ncbi:B-box zinc finger protein [Granulicella arctica]|uniref:B box-type domain-containing protein n=1 Tax=Granulicella arctica TaxID=940613 RepID=A0A7Y9PDY0_9BACT|nr:B-box zinc finger protein [Granulicella arctica]NYF77909.1 hypothetical protein [Granulicella arctica]